MMPRCIVEYEDGLVQSSILFGFECALQHSQELSVCVAVVSFAELVPEVISLVRNSSLNGKTFTVGKEMQEDLDHK